MKCLIFFGLLVLCGLVLCEDLPEEQNDKVADVENEIEDRVAYGKYYGKACKTTGYKTVCDKVHRCYPSWFYVKGVRYVKRCYNKILKTYRKKCQIFCWNEHSTKYHGTYKAYNSKRHGRKVCVRRCFKVPNTKKICKKQKLYFPKWDSKTVCNIVKTCYRVPVQKCGHGYY